MKNFISFFHFCEILILFLDSPLLRATGFLTMKVGKVVAFAVGGGIIILQVAAHQGYVNINWDKIQKKADKITDKVEEKITGEGPKFMDKVDKFFFNYSRFFDPGKKRVSCRLIWIILLENCSSDVCLEISKNSNFDFYFISG